MHPSIAISTDIPRIADLLGSARRTTTKFGRSRPVDSQNDETLGLAGPKLAALPWDQGALLPSPGAHLTDLSVMPARGRRVLPVPLRYPRADPRAQPGARTQRCASRTVRPCRIPAGFPDC